MIWAVSMLLAGATTSSNWLPLNSPSPAVARGFDAASIRRSGDQVTFNAVFAARDFDGRAQRFTSEHMVVSVRLNCRSWSVTIGAGRVQGGDGSMIGSGGEAQPTHEADPDQWQQACGHGVFGKGAPTVEAFLDQQWPGMDGRGDDCAGRGKDDRNDGDRF